MTVGSLTGTPITTPSGFSVASGAVRTDLSADFDFAFNIEPDGPGAVFLPRAELGLTSTTANPGVQRRSETFDEIERPAATGTSPTIRSPSRWASATWSARESCATSACPCTPRSRSSGSRTGWSPQDAGQRQLRLQGPHARRSRQLTLRDRSQASAPGSRGEPRQPVAAPRPALAGGWTSCSSSTAGGGRSLCASRRSRPSATRQ